MIFKTADLSDENEAKLQVVLPGLGNFGGRARFHGRMVTVRAQNDHSRLRELLWSPGEDRVLVVDNDATMSCAMFGDTMALKAIDNGWAGIVIHGCIRDAADIAGMDIGVKAIASNPLRSDRQGRGDVDVELEFLGATFRPGEYLYSDEDGILLSTDPLL